MRKQRSFSPEFRRQVIEELLSGVRGLSFESFTEVDRALRALRTQGIPVKPLERHGPR